MQDAQSKKLQRKTLREILLMSDEDFKNLLCEAIFLSHLDDETSYSKEEKAFIKKIKKEINPADIIAKARKIASKTKK